MQQSWSWPALSLGSFDCIGRKMLSTCRVSPLLAFSPLISRLVVTGEIVDLTFPPIRKNNDQYPTYEPNIQVRIMIAHTAVEDAGIGYP